LLFGVFEESHPQASEIAEQVLELDLAPSGSCTSNSSATSCGT
jgi:hypothetical protein